MKHFTFLIAIVLLPFFLSAQTPTTAASSITVTSKYCQEITVSWTSGDGAGRIVVVSRGSAFSGSIANNTFYIPRDSFGLGHSFSTTEYVCYNSFGNTTTIRNLQANTTYYIAVFEYNGSGMVFDYLTGSYPEIAVTTEWLTADFTIDDTYQCEHTNSFTFTDASSQSASAALTYGWRFGDGNTATGSSATHIYGASNVYTVELTVSSYRCRDVITKKDTVVPKPLVTFNLDPDTPLNTQIQCFQNADGSQNRFYFKNTSNNGGLPNTVTSVDWTFGDGTSGNQLNGRRTYTAPGVYTVKLVYGTILVSRQNYPADYCTDSFSLTVTVKPSPIDPMAILISDSIQCLNGNQFFFDDINPIASTNTWFLGDGNSVVGKSVSHSYANPGVFPILLEVVDADGCYDEYQDTVVVVAQPNNFYVGLDSTYCKGDNISTLIPNIPGGDFIGYLNTATGEFNPDSLGYHYISYAVDENGCEDTFTRRTLVNAVPTFSLGNDTNFCAGASIEIPVSPGSAALAWSSPSADTFITVSAEGLYWAQLTENGCSFRDSIFVRQITAPFFEFGSDSTLCGGGTVDLNITSSNATYVWSDGFVGPTRTITASGYYQGTATNKCGTFTDDITIEILPFACKIFVPNAFSPNSDNWNNVFRPSGYVNVLEMKIFNRWGEMLYESNDPNNMEWNGYFNGELVQSGNYFYVIRYVHPETTAPTVLKGRLSVVY